MFDAVVLIESIASSTISGVARTGWVVAKHRKSDMMSCCIYESLIVKEKFMKI